MLFRSGVLLRVLQDGFEVRFDDAIFRQQVVQIAINESVFPDFLDQQQFSFFTEVGPSQDGLSSAEKDSMLDVMADKLGQLEQDCRTVILYSFYQGLSHAQIAALTGYTEAFVKVKKFRCLEYLRKLVKATDVFKNL